VTDGIQGWHAHIYYDPATTRDLAARLREDIAARFAVTLGRWHDAKVGPHPAAMYQIAFDNEVFAALAPYLALHRRGLTVLIHPNTADELADHLEHAIWMGAILPLDLSVLRRGH
jgi:aromatic ring-cleaving dioxygenase